MMAVIIMLELKKHYTFRTLLPSTTSSSVVYFKLIYSYYGVFHINRITRERENGSARWAYSKNSLLTMAGFWSLDLTIYINKSGDNEVASCKLLSHLILLKFITFDCMSGGQYCCRLKASLNNLFEFRRLFLTYRVSSS